MISINESIFKSTKSLYKKAPTDSGHKNKLVYDNVVNEKKKKQKTTILYC